MNKSRRYIPECIQFLNGVIYLAADFNSNNKDQNKSLSEFELSTIFESFKRSRVKLLITQKW